MSIALANRYARALADVVAKKGDYEQTTADLESFAALYAGSMPLREVLATPGVPMEKKRNMVRSLAVRLGTTHVATNFLLVVLAHYRMALLPEICSAFRKIANRRMGVVQVRVASAAALSESETEALRGRFAELTGKRVELECVLDPTLLGGVRAQIDSTVYDGSVRGQLEQIRERLIMQ